MADPDDALIEAIAEALDEWFFRMHGITSSCSHRDEARAAYAAVVEHLGLVEETLDGRWHSSDTPHHCDTHPIRRLVSRWTEVDHG